LLRASAVAASSVTSFVLTCRSSSRKFWEEPMLLSLSRSGGNVGLVGVGELHLELVAGDAVVPGGGVGRDAHAAGPGDGGAPALDVEAGEGQLEDVRAAGPGEHQRDGGVRCELGVEDVALEHQAELEG